MLKVAKGAREMVRSSARARAVDACVPKIARLETTICNTRIRVARGRLH